MGGGSWLLAVHRRQARQRSKLGRLAAHRRQAREKRGTFKPFPKNSGIPDTNQAFLRSFCGFHCFFASADFCRWRFCCNRAVIQPQIKRFCVRFVIFPAFLTQIERFRVFFVIFPAFEHKSSVFVSVLRFSLRLSTKSSFLCPFSVFSSLWSKKYS